MRLTEPGLTIAYTGDTLSAAQVGSLPLHASGRLLLTHFWPGTDRELAVSEARRRIAGEMYQANGGAVIEVFPFDTNSREESRVWLAFMAQAAVEPDLADAADTAAQRLQSPLAARIAHSVNAGELRADIDPRARGDAAAAAAAARRSGTAPPGDTPTDLQQMGTADPRQPSVR